MEVIPAILIDSKSFSKGNLRVDIEDALVNKKLKLITSKGTLLDDELQAASMKFYIDLSRARVILSVCKVSVTQKINQFTNKISITSDDPHVLAVAVTSAATVLVSDDKDLANDFRASKNYDTAFDCVTNPCLKGNRTRKIIRRTTSQNDVNRFLALAVCRSLECPCIKSEVRRC